MPGAFRDHAAAGRLELLRPVAAVLTSAGKSGIQFQRRPGGAAGPAPVQSVRRLRQARATCGFLNIPFELTGPPDTFGARGVASPSITAAPAPRAARPPIGGESPGRKDQPAISGHSNSCGKGMPSSRVLSGACFAARGAWIAPAVSVTAIRGPPASDPDRPPRFLRISRVSGLHARPPHPDVTSVTS
jgi:hypothetical protein